MLDRLRIPEWQKKLLVALMVFGVGGMAYFITSYKLRMDARLEARLAAAKNPCKIRVFQHQGKDVVETISGLLIRADEGEFWRCKDSKALSAYPRLFKVKILHYDEDQEKLLNVLVNGISVNSYKNPSQSFRDNIKKFNEDWRWVSKIPHSRYPIDLYPNFGVDSLADLKHSDGVAQGFVFWGVRGTEHPRWKRPAIFKCWFEMPESISVSERIKYSKDVGWLINARISQAPGSAQGCEGVVWDSRSGQTGATIRLQGSQVPYIHLISTQISDFLSTILIEEEE
ncbi:hypothetical protein [Vandammella animalimorsus]|uniref:hypothetical protein n=1 Tax=Vandammella animalimorsus TaxID=2029117 RepID=UPI00118145D7|nr:hypothetical protein [Vandammella animalimorsus]